MSTRTTIPDDSARLADPATILIKLREMIASGRHPTDLMLGIIAVAAHSLTGAEGAAVAMPRDGGVVCVGRSGAESPDLGARLNVDSGISGECLRTGRILCCGDTSKDLRVDPSACREMGVRSVAVVPLRTQQGRVGVLEIISAQAHAFTDDHLDLLGRLAGLAEAAWSRDEAGATSMPSELPRPGSPASDAALERVGEVLATGLEAELASERRWRYASLIALASILAALLSVFAWKMWYRASVPSPSRRLGTSLHQTPAESRDSVALAARPEPSALVVSAVTQAPASGKSQPDPIIPDAVIRRQSLRERLPVSKSAAKVNSGPSPEPPAEDVPQLAAMESHLADLGSALLPAPAMPALRTPIAEGMAGGLPISQVQPVYPAEARRIGLEGTVVLDAFVSPRGKVEDIKLVSGPSVLAEAAIEAVSKWRYVPFVLDGRPIRKSTRINITFKLSQ